MALSKYRLGDIITPYSQKSGISNLTAWQISGVNKNKEFFEPSHQVGVDTSKYQVVPPLHFACNLMHVGRDRVLPIAYNHSGKIKYVSPAYTVFSLNEGCGVLDEYFFIMLKSEEQDRYFWFHADASVRDGMSWSDFCDVEILVPEVSVQQKYVDIYKAMVANQQSYEYGLDDLKLTFESFVEQLKTTESIKPILPYLRERTEVNNPLKCEYLRGVGNTGFISPRQERTFDSLTKCNVFYKNDFVYNPSVLCAGAIALNKEYEVAICTEEYVVFYVENQNKLIPEYLFIWLKRKETGRYIDFMSIDSVRNRVYFSDLNMISIPIPDINTQKHIVDIYNCYYKRVAINERLKVQIKNICPILIKGSLEEGKIQ